MTLSPINNFKELISTEFEAKYSEEFQCPVCFENPMPQPYAFQCLHDVCKNCLPRFPIGSNCPICVEEITWATYDFKTNERVQAKIEKIKTKLLGPVNELFEACRTGDVGKARELCNTGEKSKFLHSTLEDKTPLMEAVLHDQSEMVTALLDLGAEVNQTNQQGKTALHIACENLRVGCLKALLQRNNVDLEVVQAETDQSIFETAIHIYVQSTHEPESLTKSREIFKLLIEKDIIYNYINVSGDHSLLTFYDDPEMLAFLAARGVNLNEVKDRCANSLIQYCIKNLTNWPIERLIEHLTFLIDNGVQVCKTNDHIKNALDKAYTYFCDDDEKLAPLIAFLVKHKGKKTAAQCSDPSVHRANRFMKVCKYGDVETAKKILAELEEEPASSLIDAIYGQKTPLMAACAKNHTEMVQFLVDQGADVNKIDNGGKNAFQHAFKKGNIESSTILLNTPSFNSKKTENYRSTLLTALLIYIGTLNFEYENVSLEMFINISNLRTRMQKMIELLLEKEIDCEVENGMHPFSGLFCDLQILQILEKKEVVFSKITDEKGNTLLHNLVESALEFDVFPMISICIKNGVDPNAKNKKGETPLDICNKLLEPRAHAQDSKIYERLVSMGFRPGAAKQENAEN